MPEQSKAVALRENISQEVMNRIAKLEKEGQINLPKNYSYSNALRSAWLILQETTDKNGRPALEVCSRESIANSLLNMIIQALSPSKHQCYFIVYGKQLQLQRSYLGTIAVTKRLKGIKDVFANVIYEGDTFKYRINLETGLKEITEHEQAFENINPLKIKGAYSVVIREEAPNYVEIMNIDQIKKAWLKGKSYATGKSKTHIDFADEMAKKTVINRACKTFFDTSDDSDILIQAIQETMDEFEPEDEAVIEEKVTAEIEEKQAQEEFEEPSGKEPEEPELFPEEKPKF